MNRKLCHCFSAAMLTLCVVVCVRSALADDPCADAEIGTNKIARTLENSIGSATRPKGAFVVKRTPANPDVYADRFDIAYAVGRKIVARVPVVKTTETFWGYPGLEIRASGNNLEVTWDTGGKRGWTW